MRGIGGAGRQWCAAPPRRGELGDLRDRSDSGGVRSCHRNAVDTGARQSGDGAERFGGGLAATDPGSLNRGDRHLMTCSARCRCRPVHHHCRVARGHPRVCRRSAVRTEVGAATAVVARAGAAAMTGDVAPPTTTVAATPTTANRRKRCMTHIIGYPCRTAHHVTLSPWLGVWCPARRRCCFRC